jgi:hypothetical protein
MSKEQFDLVFDHLFEEALHESYQLELPVSSRILKDSWKNVSKHIEDQRNA